MASVAHGLTDLDHIFAGTHGQRAWFNRHGCSHRPGRALAQQGQAGVDVQSGADARQRQSKLDQGDGDRGLHADDHGLRIEDAGHGRDVAEHAADEGVDHLQRGNVDQHAAGALVATIFVGEIVLQGHRQLIVHVDLDGDQQTIAQTQNRDAVHRP